MAGARLSSRRESSEALRTGFAVIGALVTFLGLTVYFALSYGWVLTILWAWFVLSLFTNAPTLSLPVAIGLSLIVGMLTYVDTTQLQQREQTAEENGYRFAGILIRPWVTLLMGWIVHWFISS